MHKLQVPPVFLELSDHFITDALEQVGFYMKCVAKCCPVLPKLKKKILQTVLYELMIPPEFRSISIQVAVMCLYQRSEARFVSAPKFVPKPDINIIRCTFQDRFSFS